MAGVVLDLRPVAEPNDPRLDDYRDLKENQLAEDSGKFVAESEGVVRRLIASDLTVRSIVLTPHHLTRMADVLPAHTPIFVADQKVLDGIVGFHVHRGCLAIGERPEAGPSGQDRLGEAPRTLLVLEDLVDVDNVGAIVRSAAAFGAAGLVLSPRCADPFYRKAIRVSMGAAFHVPIWRCQRWPEHLLDLRARTRIQLVAAVVDPHAEPLARFRWPDQAAIVLGSEGPGLSPSLQAQCDHRVSIAMHGPSADSLNVATAGAIFLYARNAQDLARGASSEVRSWEQTPG